MPAKLKMKVKAEMVQELCKKLRISADSEDGRNVAKLSTVNLARVLVVMENGWKPFVVEGSVDDVLKRLL